MVAIRKKNTVIRFDADSIAQLRSMVSDELVRIKNVLSIESDHTASQALKSIKQIEEECNKALLANREQAIEMLQTVVDRVQEDADSWISLCGRLTLARLKVQELNKTLNSDRGEEAGPVRITEEVLALTRATQVVLLAEVSASEAGMSWASAVSRALAALDRFDVPSASGLAKSRLRRMLLGSTFFGALILGLLAFFPPLSIAAGVGGLCFLLFEKRFCAVSDLEQLREDGKTLDRMNKLLDAQLLEAQEFQIEIDAAEAGPFESFIEPVLDELENNRIPSLSIVEPIFIELDLSLSDRNSANP